MTNAPIGGRGARNSDDDNEAIDVSLSTSEAPRNQARHRLPRRSGERDRLTRPKAQRLAENVRAFWAARGHSVRVWIEPIDDNVAAEWVVRSTIVVAAPERGAKP